MTSRRSHGAASDGGMARANDPHRHDSRGLRGDRRHDAAELGLGRFDANNAGATPLSKSTRTMARPSAGPRPKTANARRSRMTPVLTFRGLRCRSRQNPASFLLSLSKTSRTRPRRIACRESGQPVDHEERRFRIAISPAAFEAIAELRRDPTRLTALHRYPYAPALRRGARARAPRRVG